MVQLVGLVQVGPTEWSSPGKVPGVTDAGECLDQHRFYPGRAGRLVCVATGPSHHQSDPPSQT